MFYQWSNQRVAGPRRLQFSLQSLIWLITAAAVLLGVISIAGGPSLDEQLTAAVSRGDASAVGWYLWLGADPDAGHGKSGYNWSPLQEAAWSGHLDVVAALVDRGAYLNYREKDGFTPIVYAADQGHWKIVKLLHEAGADHRLRGADGRSVLDHAHSGGRDDIVQLLTRRPTPRDLWRLELRDVPDETDRQGNSFNREFVLYYTPEDNWRYQQFWSFVERDANGAERTVRGTAGVEIAEDGNALIVTDADGSKRVIPI